MFVCHVLERATQTLLVNDYRMFIMILFSTSVVERVRFPKFLKFVCERAQNLLLFILLVNSFLDPSRKTEKLKIISPPPFSKRLRRSLLRGTSSKSQLARSRERRRPLATSFVTDTVVGDGFSKGYTTPRYTSLRAPSTVSRVAHPSTPGQLQSNITAQ